MKMLCKSTQCYMVLGDWVTPSRTSDPSVLSLKVFPGKEILELDFDPGAV